MREQEYLTISVFCFWKTGDRACVKLLSCQLTWKLNSGCVCFLPLSVINLLFRLPHSALLTADRFVHRSVACDVFKYIGHIACGDKMPCAFSYYSVQNHMMSKLSVVCV